MQRTWPVLCWPPRPANRRREQARRSSPRHAAGHRAAIAGGSANRKVGADDVRCPPNREEAETVAHRPEAPYSSRLPLDPEARMAMMEQSASQSLIAAALAKDGTPLPLVAYPLPMMITNQKRHPAAAGLFPTMRRKAKAGRSENSGDDDGLKSALPPMTGSTRRNVRRRRPPTTARRIITSG